MIKATIKLEDGRVMTFERETLLEAITHAEEVFYPMGAVKMDFQTVSKKEGGESPG